MIMNTDIWKVYYRKRDANEKFKEIQKAYKATNMVINDNKVGRNDACPCGSGKKYKKCCGK